MSKTNDEIVNDFINDFVEASKSKESRDIYTVLVNFFEGQKTYYADTYNILPMELALVQLTTLYTEKLANIKIGAFMGCLRSSFTHRKLLSAWYPLLDALKTDTNETPERLKKLLVGLDRRDNK